MILKVRNIYKTTLLAILFVCCFTQLKAQQQSDTLRVLFVGNSYTYFWNMPQTVQEMALNQGFPIIARKSTAGGSNWKEHWNGEKGLNSKAIIAEGNWDVVVLQNHSMSTIEEMDEFMEFGGLLINWVKQHGAKPVLYQTWAREYNPYMLESIIKGYDQLASKYNLEIVKVGELWQYALKSRPTIGLFHPDGSHPSPIGAYLTATAFYEFFTDGDVNKLPPRIKTTDKDGELLFLSIMSDENAAFLQQAVESTLKKEGNE